MKRHSVNVFSLAFGVILILLAATTAFPARGWLFGVPQWLLPAAVILVGAALMSPLFTGREGKQSSPDESDSAEHGVEMTKASPGDSPPSRRTHEYIGASSGREPEA